jgi:hypothetical protein
MQVLFKTTTVNHLELFESKSYSEYNSVERHAVRELASGGRGVGLYDAAVATAHFEQFRNKSSPEYAEVFVDAVHFQPYVYNELNKLLLNQICSGAV